MKKKVCAISVSPAIDRTVYVNDFTLDKVNRVSNFCDTPGSKGINVVINLAGCGFDCTCAGFIGGSGADFIKNHLTGRGVVCDFVPVSYDVRTNMKIVDLKNKTYTDINFSGGDPTEENSALLKQKIKKLASSNSFIAMSGNISSASLQNLYKDLINAIKDKDCKVTVDCSGEALKLAAAANPYAIKPNLEELNNAFSLNCKTYSDVKNAALRLCESGVENVLVSLDKNGAIAVSGKKAYRIDNCSVDVINTVGAGDSFLSGFIYASALNLAYTDRLKYAASFAQTTVSSLPGTAKNLSDFAKYVSQINVEEI